MFNIDLTFEYARAAALPPQSISAATNGLDIDLQQYNGGTLELAVGVGGNVAFQVQTAPDNGAGAPGTYANANDLKGNLLTVTVNASNVGVLRLDPTYLSRWVRLVATPTAAVPTSAVALLHKKTV